MGPRRSSRTGSFLGRGRLSGAWMHSNASLEPGAAFAKYRTDLMARVRAGDLQAALDHPLMLFLEFLFEIVDRMIAFDQLQLPNLASAEMIFMKIQQIKQAQSISAVKPELDNELHFLGPALAVGRSPQVAPELARFITERIKEEQALDRAREAE